MAQRVVLSESVLYFYMQWDNESIMRTALTEKKITDSLYVTHDRIAFFEEMQQKYLHRKAVADHYMKLQKLEKESRRNPELTAIHKRLKKEKHTFEWTHPVLSTGVRGKQLLSRIKHLIIRDK